jgi:hypothetical protein
MVPPGNKREVFKYFTMGIPRFGELIRRKFPNCWFQEGKAQVFTSQTGQINLSSSEVRKRRDVDTLYVDGNGLLHPAMQYTFAYGGFEDSVRQRENLSKTEDQLIREGTQFFLNAIESLCLEFKPRRLVLAIDGSAPLAKMIQQRQRRFGAKMDVTGDPLLTQAWETTLKRSIRNSLQEEGSFVSVTIEFDSSLRDAGERFISTRLELLQPGTPQQKIYSNLIENLVRERGQRDKVRWYNVLSPETPLGFQFEGRWWYSVAMAASALAWRDVWKQNTYVSLFGMESPPEVGINQSNKFIFGTGKISVQEESPALRALEEFRKFRVSNPEFFVKHSSKIAYYCERIGDHLVETSPLYREILLLTGVGTNLELRDGKRIEWLMNVRTKMIQRLEKEIAQESSTTQLGTEVEYPEYENGSRGAEGVLQISSFDSNSLTPGTSVMNLIDREIKARLGSGTMTLSDGTVLEAVYSGHRVPGEGEHKLENLIDREVRDMQGKVSLVYGLDADLFMLSLVRDYPVCLVRENNFKIEKFLGKIPEKSNSRHASCHVVDIQALRTSLQDESSIHPLDFTFLCFLFGNDFLRNVPGLLFDSKLQVVFDNKQTRNDEETNPLLFDFLFDVYSRIKTRKNIHPSDSLFTVPSTSIIKVQWTHFYEYLTELSKHEIPIYGGMIRRMQQEEEKEKNMTERQADYVPTALRYTLLKKSIKERQVVKGGVIDQKAEWVRGVDAFDMNAFKSLWTNHITSNIPGFNKDAVVPTLVRSKEDVLEQICFTYLEGMEWALRYYTNLHSFKDRQGVRKSILNTRWYYPYFHAPLLSQLRDHLWKFISLDSRRMFSMIDKSEPLDAQLSYLFPSLRGMSVSSLKLNFPKQEKDILDLLPPGYFETKTDIPPLIVEQIMSRLDELRAQMDQEQFPRSNYRMYMKRVYSNENTFSTEWSPPRVLYGYDEENMLVAPSTTNSQVQLLAVLPPQSLRFFPHGITPSNEHISWMYPKGIPVDFTFRDRVHAAILVIPPPNIPVLERFLRMVKVKESTDQIRSGMFPPDMESPKMNPVALKKFSYFDSLNGELRDIIEKQLPQEPVCVDMLAGVGISTMFLNQLSKRVFSYESHRESYIDLMENLKGSSAELFNEYYKPLSDTHHPDLVLIDLPYEGSTRNFKEIYMPQSDMPLEEIIEQLVEKLSQDESRDRLTIVIKLPRGGRLRRVVSRHSVFMRFIKDTAFDVPLTYCVITVRKKNDVPRGYSYGAPRDRSPDYVSRDRSPDYVSRDRSPDYVSRDRSPDYVSRDRSPDYVSRDRSPDYVSRDRSPPPVYVPRYLPAGFPLYDYSKSAEEQLDL